MTFANYAAALCAALCALAAPPAFAHHGKDFLLLETDDQPLAGHVYGIVSSDTVVDKDGGRSMEITPGLLFGIGDRVSVEPHLHYERTDSEGVHYGAYAIESRLNIGYLPHSDWRTAISAEYEKPNTAAESANGLARLIFVRSFPDAMVAANVLVGKDFAAGSRATYAVYAGALKPLSPGNTLGFEVAAAVPFTDGVEYLPGFYHQIGPTTNVKVGIGLFQSNQTTQGTLHFQLVQRF